MFAPEMKIEKFEMIDVITTSVEEGGDFGDDCIS
jgi:hypothetical protein